MKVIAILLFIVTLSSCSSPTDDLQAWADRIKAQPAGRIKPMPEVIEYKPHDYQSALEKSPFADLEPEIESQLRELHEGCDESIKPDSSRRKEDLERYSLDSMEMVGVLYKKKQASKWGLVKMTAGPAQGNVVYVQEGNYVGINHGKIVAIEDEQIEIITLVPDSKGCWEQRTVYMALAQ